jgi:triphosphoribosyl-dephospho-CoA synthase
LAGFDIDDGRRIYAAINAASAGGLGQVDAMDVADDDPRIDILAAMELAQHRDRIAHQWAGGFVDLFQDVVPVIAESIRDAGDVLAGIAIAHVRLLATTPDTLIARKCGWPVADEVQQRAATVHVDDPDSMLLFDRSLRTDDHRLNPGTTADLIAAGLYVLLRSNDEAFPQTHRT